MIEYKFKSRAFSLGMNQFSADVPTGTYEKMQF